MRYSTWTGKRLMTDSWGSTLRFSTARAQSASTQEYLTSSLVFLVQAGQLCCVISSRLESALAPQSPGSLHTQSQYHNIIDHLHHHAGSTKGL